MLILYQLLAACYENSQNPSENSKYHEVSILLTQKVQKHLPNLKLVKTVVSPSLNSRLPIIVMRSVKTLLNLKLLRTVIKTSLDDIEISVTSVVSVVTSVSVAAICDNMKSRT